jgi:predicted nucleic acid-binding protein
MDGGRCYGDFPQAQRLEEWLATVQSTFAPRILPFDLPCAVLWGALMGPSDQNPIDKQIAAIAQNCDLIVVTRNRAHSEPLGQNLREYDA